MNFRTFADAKLAVVKALPAADASASSDPIDLEAANLGYVTERLDAIVECEATTGLVASKTITITVEDSPNNSSYAAIPEVGKLVITGKGGNGSDAASMRFKLPPTTRRYVRATAAVESGGGTVTSQNFTLRLVG